MATLKRLSLCAMAAMALTACGDPATEAPTATPKASAAAPGTRTQATVPAAFQGLWAATMRDCDSPAETRLEIFPDRMRFYESSGPVASVQVISPDEIIIVVPLTGEGATSRRSFRYRLLGEGDRLFDVRNGLERARCPTA